MRFDVVPPVHTSRYQSEKCFYSNMHISSTFLIVIAAALLRCTTTRAINETIKEYDTKICSGEPTCHLISDPSLPSSQRSLPHRPCMCDHECVEYNDCCKDSMFYEYSKLRISRRTYYCSPTYKVYMVSNCHPDYSDQKIRTECLSASNVSPEDELILRTPVINKSRRITYANEFCAVCNGDTNFVPLASKIVCSSKPESFLNFKTPVSTQKSERLQSSSISPRKGTTGSLGFGNCNCGRLSLTPATTPASVPEYKGPSQDYPSSTETYHDYSHPNEIPSSFNTLNIHIHVSLGSAAREKRHGNHVPAHTTRSKRQDLEPEDNTEALANKVKYDRKLGKYVARMAGRTVECQLVTKLPKYAESFVRKCVPNAISQCTDSYQNEICQSYMDIKYDAKSGFAYRNEECARCGGIDVNDLSSCVSVTRQGLFSSARKGNPSNFQDPKDIELAKKSGAIGA